MTPRPKSQTEKELADYYQSHKGDISSWDEKPATIRRRRGSPSTVFTLRLTAEELTILQEAARKNKQTVSAFIRGAALRASAEGDSRGSAARRQDDHAMIDSILAGVTLLASEANGLRDWLEKKLQPARETAHKPLPTRRSA